MKSLLFGIALLIIVGVGGFLYRNVVEQSAQPGICPLDALMCPDGTSVGRTGPACVFPACPPPNVSLSEIGISFAIPRDFASVEVANDADVAVYEKLASATSTKKASIVIRRYAIMASSTPLATIQQTAISGASGMPVSATAYSSVVLGSRRFTVVVVDRFEGMVDVAYYLARSNDVLRFDAIDVGVDWTNPHLDIPSLPAQTALRKLLTNLQGG